MPQAKLTLPLCKLNANGTKITRATYNGIQTISYGRLQRIQGPTAGSKVFVMKPKGYRQPVKTRITVVLIALLLLVSLLNIALVLLMLTNRANREAKQEDISKASEEIGKAAVCVHCGSAVTGDKEENNAVKKMKKVAFGADQMCCLDHADSILHLFKIGRYMIYKAKNDSNITTPKHQREEKYISPSVHLFLDQEAFKGNAMTWSLKSGFNTAHVTGSLKFSDNTLYIQEDGFYLLYTFITLIRRDNSDDVTINHVTHSVIRHNAGGGTEVMLSRSTDLPTIFGHFATSGLEESLLLRSGDVLAVHLSNYASVYNYSISNFFGIYHL